LASRHKLFGAELYAQNRVLGMLFVLADVQTTVGAIRHEAIMVRFHEYLEANSDQPLYLPEICTAIGVAERTLCASCEEHLLGLASDAPRTERAFVCRPVERHGYSHRHRSGFWELGRFSVAYRALFGETPSKTLRRKLEPITTDLNRAVVNSAI
jgi:hypothetical protein